MFSSMVPKTVWNILRIFLQIEQNNLLQSMIQFFPLNTVKVAVNASYQSSYSGFIFQNTFLLIEIFIFWFSIGFPSKQFWIHLPIPIPHKRLSAIFCRIRSKIQHQWLEIKWSHERNSEFYPNRCHHNCILKLLNICYVRTNAFIFWFFQAKKSQSHLLCCENLWPEKAPEKDTIFPNDQASLDTSWDVGWKDRNLV